MLNDDVLIPNLNVSFTISLNPLHWPSLNQVLLRGAYTQIWWANAKNHPLQCKNADNIVRARVSVHHLANQMPVLDRMQVVLQMDK